MKVRLLHVLDLSTEPNTQGSYVRFFTVTIVLNSTLETPKKQSFFFLAQLHNISPPLTFSFVVKSTRNGKLRWVFGRFQTLIWRPGETVQNLESPGLSGRVDSPGLGGERKSPYAPPTHFHTGQTRACSLRCHLQSSSSFHFVWLFTNI